MTAPVAESTPRAVPPEAARTTMPHDRHDLAAVVVALAFCAVAALLARMHSVPGVGVENDFIGVYALQARNLLAGEPYTYPYHPPGYPALLAAGWLVVRDYFLFGKLLTIVSGGILLLAGYRLLALLWNRRVALAATAITATALLPFSYLAAADLPGAAAFVAAILALVGAHRLGTGRMVLAGLLAGIAFLLRSNGLFLLGADIVVLLAFDWTRVPLVRRAWMAAAVVAGFAVAMAPWGAYNLATVGRLVAPSEKLAQIDPAFKPPAEANKPTPYIETVQGTESIAALVARDPVRFVVKYVARVTYYNVPKLVEISLPFPAPLFAGVGLLLVCWRLDRRRGAFLTIALLGYLLLGLIMMLSRYYLWLFPLMALFAARGAFEPALTDPPRGWRLRSGVVGWMLVAAMVIWGGLIGMQSTLGEISADPVELRVPAEWLRRHTPPGTRVAAALPHVAWLADRIPVSVAGPTAEATIAEARDSSARFLEYSPAAAAKWPIFDAFADPAAAPAGLRPVYRDPASRVVLYELTPPTLPHRQRP